MGWNLLLHWNFGFQVSLNIKILVDIDFCPSKCYNVSEYSRQALT